MNVYLPVLHVKNDFLKLFLLFIATLLLLFFDRTCAYSYEKSRIAVILIADNLSIADLEASKDRNFLEKNFDGAIVSYRSGAPVYQNDLVSVFTSLNSGDRIYLPANFSAGIGNTWEIHENSRMELKFVYESLLGKKPEEDVVFTGINGAQSYLETQNSEKIGRLGNFLKKYGVLRFVFGNGDELPEKRDRSFALLICDSKGSIGDGDVSFNILKKTEKFPSGFGADYEKIYTQALQAIRVAKSNGKPAIIIIYPGDFKRLNTLSEMFDSRRYEELKKTIINEHIVLLKRISKALEEHDLLVFTSVGPSSKEARKGSVTGFIFLRGNGYNGGRYLTSETTRKEGCLFLNDVSFTIADYFRKNPPGFKGNKIEASKSGLEIRKLSEIYNEFLTVDFLRAPLLRFYVFLIVVTLLLAVLNLVSKFNLNVFSLTGTLIYLSAIIPVLMFLLGPFVARMPAVFVPLLFALSLLLSVFLERLNFRRPVLLALILLFFTLIIAVDAPFSFLNRSSVLGYSFNTGARFYGIGNEHMGIYASGVFLILALIGVKLSKKPKHDGKFYLNLLLYGILILLAFGWMILPVAGANVGGAIAVLFGSIFASYHSVARKLDVKVFVYSFLAALLFIVTIFLISRAFPAFHLAKFLSSLLSSNFDSAMSVVSRKVQLNMKLLWYTIWNKYLIAILLSLLVIITNPQGVLSRFFKKDAWGESLLAGTAFGAIFAFIFNDSGVVAAATMLIYPMMIFVSELLEIKIGVGGNYEQVA